MVEHLSHRADAEIERLAARPAANGNAGALPPESVDGLFCDLVASPVMVRPFH